MHVKSWAFLLIIAVIACAAGADAQTAKRKRATKSKRAATTRTAAKPQPAAQPDAAAPAEPATEQTQSAQPKEAERITVEELKAKLAKNEPVFIIDSRSQGSYDSNETKIKGSVRIPMDEVESRLGEIPRDKNIVVYCT
jgi:outer membrane protein OmpA-like peptidoglycan-associated protein